MRRKLADDKKLVVETQQKVQEFHDSRQGEFEKLVQDFQRFKARLIGTGLGARCRRGSLRRGNLRRASVELALMFCVCPKQGNRSIPL